MGCGKTRKKVHVVGFEPATPAFEHQGFTTQNGQIIYTCMVGLYDTVCSIGMGLIIPWFTSVVC